MDVISKKDKVRLQQLGKQIAEIAADPLQDAHRRIWTAVNDGHMIKPAVLARDYPKYLAEYGDELTTTIGEPFLQDIENNLLFEIYEWKHLRCHRVIEPVVYCPAIVNDSVYGICVDSTDPNYSKRNQEISTVKHFNRQISCMEDLEKIEYSRIEYDKEKTMGYYALLQEIFDGILPVRLFGISQFRFTPWDDLLSWMGIEEGMYDFVDNPDFMMAAVNRYTDISIDRARQYEQLGLISSNNTNLFTGNGGYGYTDRLPKPTESGIGVQLKDNWGDCADQIFTSVSPDTSEQFGYAVERRFAALFSEIYFGCCERLDNKVERLKKQIPNVRKISMSPFCNVENGMEKLAGTNTVFSFKPNSNYLAEAEPNMEKLQAELENVCRLSIKYNVQVEILMKTLITLRGEPQRLWNWCSMAVKVIDGYFG